MRRHVVPFVLGVLSGLFALAWIAVNDPEERLRALREAEGEFLPFEEED